MASEVELHDVKRWFAKYGVIWKPGGKHGLLVRQTGNKVDAYPLPTESGRRVKAFYISKARKKFNLTAADGVPDKDFFA